MSDSRQFDAAFLACAALQPLSEAQRRSLLAHVNSQCFEAGQPIVSEGAVDRSAYFCLAGEARVTRGGMTLEAITAGQVFGELALLGTNPRAASIVAATPLWLAQLPSEAYRGLFDSQPALARDLVGVLVAGMGEQLTRFTDNMSRLLGERSLPRRSQVQVTLGGERRAVATGVRCGSLLPERIDGRLVVAALVDHTPRSLDEPLAASCTLEPLSTAHWEGQRIYRKSLGLLLLEAASRLGLPVPFSLGRSLGAAYRFVLHGDPGRPLPELAAQLEAEMRALVAADQRLREEYWSIGEAREHFASSCPEAGALLSTWRDPAVLLVSYGQLYALRMEPLVHRTGLLDEFSVAVEKGHLLLVHGSGRAALAGSSESVLLSSRLLAGDQEPWLTALGITHVAAYNQACIEGEVTQLIRVNEGFHEKGLSRIADSIAEREGRTRVVCVAGPSSSGKTTFIRRLRIQLQVAGLTPRFLSLDDYYVDRERTPRDEVGGLDFEALEALDLPLLRAHVAELLAGKRVKTSRYDFKTGRSLPDGGPEMALQSHEILMLEGIHGLNPALLGTDDPRQLFRILVGPVAQLPFDQLSQVHSSDLRLLRRIVRDRHARATTAEQTILRWPSVRHGERHHIFPYAGHADAVFDSSLVYELSVLKVYAERYLLEVPQRSASYMTAVRLLQLLQPFVSIYPDHVPSTSILREFIGGSGFDY
jgi:uridine kinase